MKALHQYSSESYGYEKSLMSIKKPNLLEFVGSSYNGEIVILTINEVTIYKHLTNEVLYSFSIKISISNIFI